MPFNVDVSIASVVALTAVVVTRGYALVAPAAMLTLAGGTKAGLLLCRVITTPPAGAGPVNETATAGRLPPVRIAGLMLRDFKTGANTVKAALWTSPPRPAVIVTGV